MTHIVAEIGSTHDGSVGIARNSIAVAASCGATAVKFQTHLAAAETTRNAPAPPFFNRESRFEYFERTAFTARVWRELLAHAHQAGVAFVCSPFSIEAVALLEDVGIDIYKIPSGEVTNLPLLHEVAQTKRPVMLSSGMSTWAELDAAVDALQGARDRLTVLQCTSMYPCPPERVGLNVLDQLRRRYGLAVGLSDHTVTNHAAFAAVALGAETVERHFTLSRHLYGSDAAHSSEPDQFRELVEGIRAIERMRAMPVDKDTVDDLGEMRRVFQKSIVAVVDIPAGAVLVESMLGLKKPGTGFAPDRLPAVIGRRARRLIPADSVLTEEDVDGQA
jgi:N,N'-diacetyllegionaminate synthase